MPFETRVALAGSERQPPLAASPLGPVDPNEIITVSMILRRRGADPAVESIAQNPLSHDELAALHGAEPDDLDVIDRFASQFGLAVVDGSILKRRVQLTGTVSAFANAFGADLQKYQVPGTEMTFRGRTGPIFVPSELESAVVAVLGLDNRAVARAHFCVSRRIAAHQTTAGTFTPPQVAQLYQYPQGVNGAGQTIAIIELGGGYSAADLNTYFSGLGIQTPSVAAVSVDGGANTPGGDADGEVMLDIEVAGAMAPGANIAVYFAPNTDQGFIDAITDAAHDTTRKPSIISISWGGPEDSWTQQSRDAMNQALQDAAMLGVTVTIAAGDNGSSDGAGDGKLHVDFPASSPWVLACGGTTLVANGTTIQSETVWNEVASGEGATGGGVSIEFPLPTWQANAGVPNNPETNASGRGVPDVAGVADPSTGYQILFDGQQQIVGGTSAVAPQWAALIALLNQSLGKALGFVNPQLYGITGSGFNDITSGNNDDSGLGAYSAGPGWDACTGLGSPDGTALLSALQQSAQAASAL